MPALPYIYVAIAAYGANEQRLGVRAQRRAVRRERAVADVENLRERKQALRQQRIATAQIQNAAAVNGVGNSSGVAGGVASLGSSTAANIGTQQQILQLNQQRLSFLSSAAQHGANADTAASVGSFVGGAGGAEGVAKWFT